MRRGAYFGISIVGRALFFNDSIQIFRFVKFLKFRKSLIINVLRTTGSRYLTKTTCGKTTERITSPSFCHSIISNFSVLIMCLEDCAAIEK